MNFKMIISNQANRFEYLLNEFIINNEIISIQYSTTPESSNKYSALIQYQKKLKSQ